MSKVAVGVVAGVAVAGAVGFGTLVYPDMRARQEVDKAIAELPKEMKASYRDVRYSLFSRKLTIGGLEMVVEDGGQSISTRVDSLSLTDVAKDRVGHVQGTGLVMETADRSLRAQVGQVTGDGLAAPIGMLSAMGVAAPTALNVKNLTLSDVSINAEGETVKLREIAIADFAQTDKTPLSMTFGLHGLQVDPATIPDAEAREGLAKLGYDKLSLDLDLSYVHNPEAKRLNVKQVSVGGDNIGRLGLSFELGNVEAALGADPMVALAAVQGATLERLELRYDDSSLAGRLLKAAANEAGMAEAEFKSMLLAQVAEAGTQAAEVPMTKEVLDSAIAFINNPKSLSLRLQPPRPLPLGALMAASQDPVMLAQAAGMSVSANR